MSLETQFKLTFLKSLQAIASSKTLQEGLANSYQDFIHKKDYIKEKAPHYGLSIYSPDTQAYLLASIKSAFDKSLEELNQPNTKEQCLKIFKEDIKPLIPSLVTKPNDALIDKDEKSELETVFDYIHKNTTKEIKSLSSPSLLNTATRFFGQNRDELTVGGGLLLAAAAATTAAVYCMKK